MTDSANLARIFILTEATNDQLSQLVEAIKVRREMLTRDQRRSLSAGQRVTFSSRGLVYTGVIDAIRLKRATVRCDLMNGRDVVYVVPLNMLTAA